MRYVDANGIRHTTLTILSGLWSLDKLQNKKNIRILPESQSLEK